jgi:anti-sigma regulatory factor (Ser/Thr protein kinase)
MERHFKRDLNALSDVFSFIDGFVDLDSATADAAFPLRIAVEEIFVNMVSHNPHGSGDISVGLELEGSKVTTTLMDFDSEPFDLTEHVGPDINAPLEQRRIGGLGIHLVKSMMDEVHYEYKDRRTQIRMVKYLRD